VVAGTLRVPLSQPQNRRIQPERYTTKERKNIKREFIFCFKYYIFLGFNMFIILGLLEAAHQRNMRWHLISKNDI